MTHILYMYVTRSDKMSQGLLKAKMDVSFIKNNFNINIILILVSFILQSVIFDYITTFLMDTVTEVGNIHAM